MASDSAMPGRCPICGAAAEPRWRPFCSRRCSQRDLMEWLAGGYSLPGESLEDTDAGEGFEEEVVH